MTCSPARLAANRANAQKSTGPRTEQGKMRSRANSIKHGLCCSVVVAEDADLVRQRADEWFWALKPQDDFDAWIVDKLAVVSIRIDRAERMERRLRDRRSLRAELAWDDQARLEAESLGEAIGTSPARVVEQLRGTPSGCDWLISRWSMLAHAAEQGEWTAGQVALAFHLLGTPYEFRQGRRPGDLLDGAGLVIESGDDQATVARREVAHLEERRAVVADLDEVDRSLAEADLFDESHRELKNLRRYDGALHRRLRWFLAELRYVSPNFKPGAELVERMVFRAAAEAPAEPEPAPAKAVEAKPEVGRWKGPWEVDCPHPPFEIEPGEVPADGSRANLLKVLLTRQEKREKRAESRREARRRKAEALRSG